MGKKVSLVFLALAFLVLSGCVSVLEGMNESTARNSIWVGSWVSLDGSSDMTISYEKKGDGTWAYFMTGSGEKQELVKLDSNRYNGTYHKPDGLTAALQAYAPDLFATIAEPEMPAWGFEKEDDEKFETEADRRIYKIYYEDDVIHVYADDSRKDTTYTIKK